MMDLAMSLSSLLAGGEKDPFHLMTSLANASACLMQQLPDVSWAGFYLLSGQTLYLGPFQGKVACTKIPLGKGVCGTAAQKRQTIVVPDVHQFPGHIACDRESRSEIVVPLIASGRVVGVLDLDSNTEGRFTQADAAVLEEAAGVIVRLLFAPT